MGNGIAIAEYRREQRQQRTTPAKKIIAHALRWEFQEAVQIARYNKVLDELEFALDRYYFALDTVEEGMRGRFYSPYMKPAFNQPPSPREMRIFRKNLKECEKFIADIFLDAVDKHDGKTIIRLAHAVWFFGDKRRGQLPHADRERALLVGLKSKLASSGEKYTIKDIAKFLFLEGLKDSWSKDAQADGFSKLRRKCKALGVPIEPSRKTKQR